MKKALVAVTAGAALMVATVSNAQAQDEAGPFIAGAVIGTVVGVVLSKRLEVLDEPVEPAPPPRVVVVERQVIVKRPPPVYVHHRHHHRHWRDRRRDWH